MVKVLFEDIVNCLVEYIQLLYDDTGGDAPDVEEGEAIGFLKSELTQDMKCLKNGNAARNDNNNMIMSWATLLHGIYVRHVPSLAMTKGLTSPLQ